MKKYLVILTLALLPACENMDPETRAMMLRLGERTADRILDSKFPPAKSGKAVVPSDGPDTTPKSSPEGPSFGPSKP